MKVGKKTETKVLPGPQAQVALIVLDPHTGAVLALVGGRDYGWSQLNHAVSKRPTGSIFKPFVYAAAMNSALDGSPTVLTPASTVTDAPSSFAYGDQIYEPRNYKEEYHGRRVVALRAGHVAEQCDGESGRRGRLRQSGKSGKVGGDHLGEGDSGDGPGFLRCFAAGHGGRLHDIREQRGAPVADFAALGAQWQGRCDRELQHRPAAGARPADCLHHDQHDGGRDQQRAGIFGGSRARIYRSSGGQDRQFTRWLVRGIHLEFAVYRLGGI